jgi:hypothetical protein
MLRRIMFLVLALSLSTAVFAGEWVGYITDEHCGTKGAKKGHGSCALSCAGRGAALLLYNVADEKLYKLDDQEAAKRMAGNKVKVTGELEEGTIKVKAIVEEAEE